MDTQPQMILGSHALGSHGLGMGSLGMTLVWLCLIQAVTCAANDLNPESYKAMCENAKLNKVTVRHSDVQQYEEERGSYLSKCLRPVVVPSCDAVGYPSIWSNPLHYHRTTIVPSSPL